MSNDTKTKELLKSALLKIRSLKKTIEDFEYKPHNDRIAIIGMSCRYPGITSVNSFWNFLINKTDGISEVPSDRWDITNYYNSDKSAAGKVYTDQGGFIKDIDKFDPLFFGISPKEALLMDPQQRILLEVCWEAIENSSIIVNKSNNKQLNTGVFIGVTTNDYYNKILDSSDYNEINAFYGTGNAHNSVSGRISHSFGLNGPSIAIDTACSSSLVSVHLACQSLLNQECSTAIAGGVNAILHPVNSIITSQSKMLSADGRCKTFDNTANGYIRSEGCGIIVLKKYEDAVKDGDNILAVIKASSVNHNAVSSAMSVPNMHAQAQLIKDTLKKAGLSSGDISYIESHGTGTNLGDPIEIRALDTVFSKYHSSDNPLYIGALKSNIGHAESAAGVAGLIKAVLCLNKQQIPANLHLVEPNKNIDWEKLPFIIPTETIDWKPKNKKRYAGVSSFGVSGTNAHIILEEPENSSSKERANNELSSYVFTVSAKTQNALDNLKKRYHDYLNENPNLAIRNICLSSNLDRNHFDYRYAAVVSDTEQLKVHLASQSSNSNKIKKNNTVFLFSDSVNISSQAFRNLYDNFIPFKNIIDQCEKIINKKYSYSILSLLENPESLENENRRYRYATQFCVQYAMAKTWISWNIKPASIVSYGIGEISAACFSEIFSLDTGIDIIHKWLQCIEKYGQKEVVYQINTSKESLLDILNTKEFKILESLDANTVISIDESKVKDLRALLLDKNISSDWITSSYLSDKSGIEKSFLEETFSDIVFNKPVYKFIPGNINKILIGDISVTDYWMSLFTFPVGFYDKLKDKVDFKESSVINIGSENTFTRHFNILTREETDITHTFIKEEILPHIFNVLVHHYECGNQVTWNNVFGGKHEKIRLPNYPFEKQSYWYNPMSTESNNTIHPFLQHVSDFAKNKDTKIYNFNINRLHEYINDHCILEDNIIPATAYIEMMLIAAKLLPGLDMKNTSLENISFTDFIHNDLKNGNQMQLIAEKSENGFEFSLYTCNDDELGKNGNNKGNNQDYRQFSQAALTNNYGSICDKFVSRPDNYEFHYSGKEFYMRINKNGYNYGNAFKGVKEVYTKGDEIWGEVDLSTVIRTDKYLIHPAILDSCFQLVAAKFINNQIPGLYVPVFINTINVTDNFGENVFCYIKVYQDKTDKSYTADIQICNKNKETVATITTIVFRKAVVDNQEIEYDTTKLYSTIWEPSDNCLSEPENPENIIIFDPFEEEKSIAKLFTEQNYKVEQVKPEMLATQYNGSFDALFENISFLPDLVIFAWPLLHIDLFHHERLYYENGIVNLLNLLKTIQKKDGNSLPRIVIMSSPVNSFESTADNIISHDELWSAISVINQEEPRFRCRIIGIDPKEILHEKENLIKATVFNTSEEQIIIHKGKYLSSRLQSLVVPKNNIPLSYKLKTSQPGIISNLYFNETTPTLPGDDEVIIDVIASGLNFKEVLFALGTLPLENYSEFEFGFEASGIVRQIGKNVQNVKKGEAVIATLATGCLGSFAKVNKLFVFRKPENISFQEAATLPVVYLTSYYALIKLAGITSDSKILIHAAAGGVGLAALQIARLCKSDIYATASKHKHSYLKSQGANNLYNSRNLNFKDEILNDTKGKGVDVVLNSLSGEYMDKSLDLLAAGGCFVEIGIVSDDKKKQILRKRPDISYYNFDIGELAKVNPGLFNEVFNEVLEKIAKNELLPIKYQTFGITKVEEAFRYLAQGKNIGKVVITHYENKNVPLFTKDEWFIITGGYGGLGLNLIKWMHEKGARKFIVVSRSGKPGHTGILQEYDLTDTQIENIQLDVSDSGLVREMFDMFKKERKNIGGIFHTAGVLHDALLVDQSKEKVIKTLTPKLKGAISLHTHSQQFNIKYFVCFSSIASVLGSTGQYNYATANGAMDAFIRYRRTIGLPGTALNWSAFNSYGMASDLRIQLKGINKLNVKPDFNAMEIALRNQLQQVYIADINWKEFFRSSSYILNNCFLSKMTDGLNDDNEILEETKDRLENFSRETIEKVIEENIKQTLGIDESFKIDPEKSLFDYGLDSLMAVELKNKIEKITDIKIAATILFNYPTLRELSDFIVENTDTGNKQETTEQNINTGENLQDAELLPIDELTRLLDDELNDL